MIGTVVDRFVLQRVVGEGAMAVVFLAIGPDGEPVAVKMLKPSVRNAPGLFGSALPSSSRSRNL